MSKTWMKIIEHAGDPSIGAALVRLARQAERVHMFERAAQLQEPIDPAGGTGRAPWCIDRPFASEAKEASR